MAILTGTTGNDTYTGTADEEDTAVIDTFQRQATLRFDGTNWTVLGAATGNDVLLSIEKIRFRDATLTLTREGGGKISDQSSYIPSLTSSIALSDGRALVLYTNSSSGYVTYGRFLAPDGSPTGTPFGIVSTTFLTGTGLPGGGFALTWSIGNDAVYARFAADGSMIGTPRPVHDVLDGTQSATSITALANGGVAVTWFSSTDTSGSYLRIFDAAGNAASGEIALAPGASVRPELTTLADGRIVAMWQVPGQILTQIFAADGTATGAATPIGASQTYSDSTIVALGKGFAITWATFGAGGDGSDYGVAVQLFDRDGVATGAPITVNTTVQGRQDQPAIAVLADGGFVVTWTSQVPRGDGNYDISVQAQRFDASGTRIGGEIAVQSGATSSVYWDYSPTVVAQPDGGFTITMSWNGLTAAGYDSDGVRAFTRLTGDAGDNVLAPQYTVGTGFRIEGGDGDDTLTGQTLADVLIGGGGADVLVGGYGNDTYVADDEDQIVETADGGIDTVQVRDSYALVDRWVENIWLMSDADATLIGNSLANTLIGNAGDDVLNGAQGADRMEGRGGNDTYIVDSANDVVIEAEGAGIDTVVSSVSHFLSANVENLRLTGYASVAAVGNALDNQLYGNAANNSLEGGAGRDLLVGGLGDDTYFVDAGDQLVEAVNEGFDRVVSAVSWVLGANFERLDLATGAINGTGNELANVIVGNEANNVLDGGAGADVMDGGTGNDTYVVDDLGDIAAESNTQAGRDLVLASVSHALGLYIEDLTLVGTADIDGTGNFLGNTITGNAGANVLDGGSGTDTLIGGLGNDTLRSSDGSDRLLGGVGDDQYLILEGDEVIERFGQGVDTVTVQVSRSYALGRQIENLVLLGFDVDGYGNLLDNAITGTLGANLIDGGRGADRLAGLAGNDVYLVDNAGDVVVEEIDAGIDEIVSTVTQTLAANVENLTLAGVRRINGNGNALDNRIVGNAAVNILRGGAGNDTLIGGGNADSLSGDDGDDMLVGSADGETFNGGTGVDTVSYFSIAGSVSIALGRTAAQDTGAGGRDTLLAIENVEGSNVGDDTLTGGGNDNRIAGNGGNDRLSGAAGNDTLLGGEGDDTILADVGNDTIDGGSGIDLLSFAAATSAVSVDLGIVTAQTTGQGDDAIRNIERVEGSNTAADRIAGNHLDNQLYGLGGNDVLSGGDGADLLDGGAGTDTASYAAAAAGIDVDLRFDTALDDGFGKVDTFVGIENVVGSAFDDEITGSAGRNVLTGGGGRDLLTGGASPDVFVYLAQADSTVAARGRDVILDFTTALDKIDLSAIDANTATSANDAFTSLIAANQTFGAAGQLQIIGGILYGNTDADAQAEFAIDLGGATIVIGDLVL